MTLEQRIHDILVDVLMLEDPTRVTPEAQIVRDLGAESINIAEIAVAIENEFDLEVDAASIQKGLTVAGLTSMVQEALAAK